LDPSQTYRASKVSTDSSAMKLSTDI
jgi:hypothetical protein